MTYCRSEIDSPAFLYGAGDCDSLHHDLQVSHGGLAPGDDLVSAVLIQLGSDAREAGERGWWGDQFQPFPLGNRMWTLAGKPAAAAGMAARVDEAMRDALQPMIRSGMIEAISVRTVRTMAGAEVALELTRGGAAILKATING